MSTDHYAEGYRAGAEAMRREADAALEEHTLCSRPSWETYRDGAVACRSAVADLPLPEMPVASAPAAGRPPAPADPEA